jgi:hypothetical protein
MNCLQRPIALQNGAFTQQNPAMSGASEHACCYRHRELYRKVAETINPAYYETKYSDNVTMILKFVFSSGSKRFIGYQTVNIGSANSKKIGLCFESVYET